MTTLITSIPKDTVLARLAALHAMPIAQLKQQWRELFGKEPPPFTRKGGRQYRYYVAQAVLKDQDQPNPDIVRRIAAAEIEQVVLAQVRALVRQPEVIVGTWRAAREEAPDVTEADIREALEHLEPMWEELFPAEQARLVQLLVERVTVGPTGADIKLRVDGLSNLVRDLRGSTAMREAA